MAFGSQFIQCRGLYWIVGEVVQLIGIAVQVVQELRRVPVRPGAAHTCDWPFDSLPTAAVVADSSGVRRKKPVRSSGTDDHACMTHKRSLLQVQYGPLKTKNPASQRGSVVQVEASDLGNCHAC